MILVIPLKPEFLGTYEDSDELVSVAFLNYATIFRVDSSLYKSLRIQEVQRYTHKIVK